MPRLSSSGVSFAPKDSNGDAFISFLETSDFLLACSVIWARDAAVVLRWIGVRFFFFLPFFVRLRVALLPSVDSYSEIVA